MRTQLFNNYADLPKEFREDLQALWSLSAQQRKALVPHVGTLAKVEIVGRFQAALDSAVSEIGGDSPSLLRALKVVLFIFKSWNPVNDTAEGFLRDLGELGLIPEEHRDEVTAFLLDFLAVVEADNTRRLEKMHAASLLPNFRGVEAVVDFRAVISKPFGSGLEDKLDQYEPRCVSAVPIIILKFQSNESLGKPFIVQCEEQDLRIMLDSLNAALKDLEASRRSFSLSKG